MEKYASGTSWLLLMVAVGITSIIDDHLSKSWVIAKVIAIAVISFVAGMSYASAQPQKKKKR